MDAKEVWDCESHKQSAPVYKRVCLLGGKESVELVEKLATGRLYVRKTLLQYDREVYETLKQKQIPGIPQIESLTYLPDRLIVMEEYVEGQSLYTHLQSHLFTPMEALDIFRKLEKILSALHGLHPAIIHRDIKPGNVLLTPSGEVYLIDFNAARQYMPEKTEDTVILGTNGYAAPEQYGFAQTDPRSDVYSMAVMFCVMISGKTPAQGLECPKKVRRVLQRAMDLSPEQRYPDVRSFVTALSTAVTGGILGKIPGFRQGKLSHKIGALCVYFAILCAAIDFHLDGVRPVINGIGKVLVALMYLMNFALCVDAGGIRRFFPGSRLRNIGVRYVLIYLYLCLIDVLTVLAMAVLRLV